MSFLGLFFVIFGASFVFLAGMGIVKMPTFFMRMQATSKASTVGVMMILLGGCLMHQSLEATIKSFVIILFLLLTTPVATHALARTAKSLAQDE